MNTDFYGSLKFLVVSIISGCATISAWASQAPSIRWLGGEAPMSQIAERTEFPFKISNKVAGSVVLVPERERGAPNEGTLLIKKGQSEKRLPGQWGYDRIQVLGLVQFDPGSDSLVIHLYSPINHAASNEHLIWYDLKTGDSIWRRYENYWRKEDPTFSTSDNYMLPAYRQARQLLDHLAKERFPEPSK
jgi:hypothetical protein